MIVDKQIYCLNQPGIFKPCDYEICQYYPSMHADVNPKYAGLFVKYYGNGQFEFLNNLIIKKGVELNGTAPILVDFGKKDSDQPLGFVNYQDFLAIGRPADGTGYKLLRLRFGHEEMDDLTVHHWLKLHAVYDYDASYNVKYYSYNRNKGYTFSENVYVEMSGMLFTTNSNRFHTYLTLGLDDD